MIQRVQTMLLLGILGLSLLQCCAIIGVSGADNPALRQVSNMTSTGSNYTTYFGGSSQEDATKITFDQEGNVILIGQTQSDDFPSSAGAAQEDYAGDWDAFVAKFSIGGNLLWATYLGGTSYEHITAANVDGENNIVVAGTTGGAGFPITPDAHQRTIGGGLDGFIAKLAPNGTLMYSSFFGGPGEDWIYGMEFDPAGNYMFSGFTASEDLGTSGVFQETKNGSWDAFVAKVNSLTGDTLMFSYLGGGSNDRAWFMTIDSENNYLIGGMTTSDDLPTSPGAYQEDYADDTDAWVAKVSEDGSDVIFCSYVGGSDEDICVGIDTDANDNIFFTGNTMSDDLRVVNALNTTYLGGAYDSFISKWNSSGGLSWLTYFGGSGNDRIWDCRVDPHGDLVVVARTSSDDYPITHASQSQRAGNYDACAAKISSDGQTFLASSYIGGSLEDIGEGLAIGVTGNVVISGRTSSTDFPATSGAYQEDSGGSTDVFVCHTIFDVPPTSTSTTSTPTSPPPGGFSFDPLLLIAGGGIGITLIVVIVIIMKRR